MKNLVYGGKLLFLLLFSGFVMYHYYGVFGRLHNDVFVGYTTYIILLLIVYIIYKGYHYITQKQTLSFSPLGLTGYFLLHLFLLCAIFTEKNGVGFGMAFTVFFHILSYLLFPTLVVGIVFAFGKKLLSYLPSFSLQSHHFQKILSLGVGFFVFITLLTLCAFVNLYNLVVVFVLLGGMAGLAWRQLWDTLKSLIVPSIEFENHKYDGGDIHAIVQTKLLSAEFFFLVITFLISVNFISILRPMPIGWDDMGVYMNYPQLLANAGGILSLGGMLSWQIFTGIGYMFHSATLAFYLNNVGSVLSVLVIIWSIADLLGTKSKTFLHIPSLVAMMFLSLPMIIFQQAKDMKLDTGLFFISIVVIYGFIALFRMRSGQKESEDQLSKASLLSWFSHGEGWYVVILGLLTGLAFSIKFTTLLLVTGMFGAIFYYFLGVLGFLGYGALFVGIFTKLGLWSMMNVVYPVDDLDFRNTFFVISMVLGVGLWGWAITHHSKDHLVGALKWVVVFLTSMAVALLPWIGYNYSTSHSFAVGSLLSGKGESFPIDYEKIYSKAEIEKIQKTIEQSSMSTSGTTQNEDLGRYFGYEKGINNYIKLPYNLTTQNNQSGEYTDITYWFFALIPVIVLFFSYRSIPMMLGVAGVSLFCFTFYFFPFTNTLFTKIFSTINLPLGYAVIVIFFLVPLLIWLWAMKDDEHSKILKIMGVFGVWYIFFWSISAFGIVWYGVAMYYILLVFIAFGVFYITRYKEETTEEIYHDNMLHLLGTILIFVVINIYTFNSTLPHGMNNIVSSSYTSFKTLQVPKYSTIFNSQPSYFEILTSLNIDPKKQNNLLAKSKAEVKSDMLKKALESSGVTDIFQYQSALNELYQYSLSNAQFAPLRSEIQSLLESLYASVLYPSREFKNPAGIYRIGTFLRYFISDNHKRLMEDSLVTEFDRYFYDSTNVDIAVQRMKTMGVDYFLVDLNAATIDRDPRRDLTRRYENLLKTFTSEKLSLISTDSLCLRIALENYNASDKDPKALEQYMNFAGVNYESYDEQGQLTQSRGQKQIGCYNAILKMIQEKKIDATHYPYLIPVEEYIKKNKFTSEEEMLRFFQTYVTHGWVALFKIGD